MNPLSSATSQQPITIQISGCNVEVH
jgi:hypothetical protein